MNAGMRLGHCWAAALENRHITPPLLPQACSVRTHLSPVGAHAQVQLLGVGAGLEALADAQDSIRRCL